jgi:hypothetical protein
MLLFGKNAYRRRQLVLLQMLAGTQEAVVLTTPDDCHTN